MNSEGPPGFGLRQSSGAFGVSAACPKRQGTAAVHDAIALARAGAVEVADKLARFTRPGLVEEYSVSMDGVRQDFVVLERPAGAGELAVRLAVSGAKVEPAACGARLVLQNSGREIACSRLRVTDATGKELTAHMEVGGARAPRIRLAVFKANPHPKAPEDRENRTTLVQTARIFPRASMPENTVALSA